MSTLNKKLSKYDISPSGLLSVVTMIFLFTLMLVAITEFIIPAVNKYRPIVKNPEIYNVMIDHAPGNRSVVGSVYMQKNLKCRYLGNEAGYVLIDGVWEESGFDFVDDLTPGNSHPQLAKKASFGVWRWSDWKVAGEVTDVMVTVEHICDGKDKLTVINGEKVSVSIGQIRTTKVAPEMMSTE